MIFFQLIGFIAIVFLLMAFFTVLSIIIRFWNIIKAVFRIGGRQKGGNAYNKNEYGGFNTSSNGSQYTYQHRQTGRTSGTRNASPSQPKGKIIPDDEGEYVDFEEIK